MTTTEQRAALAEELFSQAATNGSVDLAVLTNDHEFMLGQGLWAFTDTAAWVAWSARSEEARAQRSSAALEELVRAGLVERPTSPLDGARFPVSAALGVVMTARRQATFMISVLGPDGLSEVVLPYGYGLIDERGLRGIVIELRHHGRHEYRLVSPPRAASGLGEWALAAVTGTEVGAQCDAVVIQIYRHRADEEIEEAAVYVPGTSLAQAGLALYFGGRRVAFPADDKTAIASAIEDVLLHTAHSIETPDEVAT